MQTKKPLSRLFFLLLMLAIIAGCNEDDSSLAPYAGSPEMSTVTVEKGSFTPKITWTGGYVSVVGVNVGEHATLDSTLIWLVYGSGDGITYPVTFGTVPAGAQNLTSQYGGEPATSLSEDNTYTYWVLKDYAWNKVIEEKGKVLMPDSSLGRTDFGADDDTLRVSSYNHTQATQSIDVFINIDGITTFGQLGVIDLVETQDTLGPRVTWEITQSDIEDSSIAAMGLVAGGQYDPTQLVWEVYSVEDSAGKNIYGSKNIISRPVYFGQEFEGSHVFQEMAPGTLERDKTYYIWIASKEWDGETRLRFAKGYAYATFSTR